MVYYNGSHVNINIVSCTPRCQMYCWQLKLEKLPSKVVAGSRIQYYTWGFTFYKTQEHYCPHHLQYKIVI